jgi:hypothetical protein
MSLMSSPMTLRWASYKTCFDSANFPDMLSPSRRLPMPPYLRHTSRISPPWQPRNSKLKSSTEILWDLGLLALNGHTEWVTSVAFSHDGKKAHTTRHCVSGMRISVQSSTVHCWVTQNWSLQSKSRMMGRRSCRARVTRHCVSGMRVPASSVHCLATHSGSHQSHSPMMGRRSYQAHMTRHWVNHPRSIAWPRRLHIGCILP